MKTLKSGEIEGHEARGQAALVEGQDGRLRVELRDLWIANGAPDVRLFVTNRKDERVDDTATDLGKVPDGRDTLDFDVPVGVTADQINTVMVYCKIYNVLFGAGLLRR